MNAVSRGVGSLILRKLTGPARQGLRRVDPRRFGIELKSPECDDRAGEILTAFFNGFEGSLTPLGAGAVQRLRRSELSAPFFEEGFAMGCLPNGYLRLLPARSVLERFELAHGESDPYVFLRYVGLGFWLGFQHARAPAKIDAFAARLKSRRHAPLVHDGYGFKTGFFGHARLERGDLSLISILRGLHGFGFESALNGLGRSLWFFTMDRPAHGFDLARSLGAESRAALGGMGLAAAFTFPDQLERSYGAADLLAGEEKAHFLKGIRIALFVRAKCERRFCEERLERLAPHLKARAEKDLERALRVGAQSGHKDDFIEAFHRGCLEA